MIVGRDENRGLVMTARKSVQRISKNELLNFFEKYSARIDILPTRQKAFVRLFMSEQKFRTLAKAAGVNEANIARKLKKIAKKLSSDNFAAVLSQNQPMKKMEIMRDYFLEDTPMIKISEKRNMTYYAVRKLLRAYSGQHGA